MCSFVFLSSQLQKTPEPPFLSDRRLQFGPQPALFLFLLWFFPVVTLQGAFRSLWPLPVSPSAPLCPPPCLFLQSPQQNVMLWFFFLFLYGFCVFVFNFSFPTKIMPRKKQVLHVSCCFFTPSYISPSPLCFLWFVQKLTDLKGFQRSCFKLLWGYFFQDCIVLFWSGNFLLYCP